MIDRSRTPDRLSCKRARDGRCGQRQHVHIAAHLLEPLFVRHPEMLLFIDDQEGQGSETELTFVRSAWVPTTISTVPRAIASRVAWPHLWPAQTRLSWSHLDQADRETVRQSFWQC